MAIDERVVDDADCVMAFVAEAELHS